MNSTANIQDKNPEMCWSPEMSAFYNSPWGRETYTPIKEEHVEWPEFSDSQRAERNCSMCGIGGHDKTTCPDSCCLNCGEKTDSYQDDCRNCLQWSSAICPICGDEGHLKRDCPFHWKCYHSTINEESTPQFQFVEEPRNCIFTCTADETSNSFYGRFKEETKMQDAANGQKSIAEN